MASEYFQLQDSGSCCKNVWMLLYLKKTNKKTLECVRSKHNIMSQWPSQSRNLNTQRFAVVASTWKQRWHCAAELHRLRINASFVNPKKNKNKKSHCNICFTWCIQFLAKKSICVITLASEKGYIHISRRSSVFHSVLSSSLVSFLFLLLHLFFLFFSSARVKLGVISHKWKLWSKWLFVPRWHLAYLFEHTRHSTKWGFSRTRSLRSVSRYLSFFFSFFFKSSLCCSDAFGGRRGCEKQIIFWYHTH